jgi:hypothetical protein
MLAIVNNVINMAMQLFLCYSDLNSIVYTPSGGIYGSEDKSIFSFFFKTGFHNGCINLHSYQLQMSSLFSAFSSAFLILFFIFMIIAIIMGEMTSHCRFDLCFLVINDEQFYICLTHSFKYLLSYLPH